MDNAGLLQEEAVFEASSQNSTFDYSDQDFELHQEPINETVFFEETNSSLNQDYLYLAEADNR